MNEQDLKNLIEIRANLIEIYNFLDAKNEPSSLVKQQDIARELDRIIPKIDKILQGKVRFS